MSRNHKEHEIVSLAEGLPREIKRVREKVLPVYQELPKESGSFSILLINADLKYAEQTTVDQDTVGMLKAFYRLKGWVL